MSKYHKSLKENYLKRKHDIYYSLESTDSNAEEDNLKFSKDKKNKKIDELNKNEQAFSNDQATFRRYVLYSHENKVFSHEEKENFAENKNEKDGKGNDHAEENEQQLMNYLENAAKYFRNCIMLLKNKYKADHVVFSEAKYEIKVEKNETKSAEEAKDVEINKFSETISGLTKFIIKLLFFCYFIFRSVITINNGGDSELFQSSHVCLTYCYLASKNFNCAVNTAKETLNIPNLSDEYKFDSIMYMVEAFCHLGKCKEVEKINKIFFIIIL